MYLISMYVSNICIFILMCRAFCGSSFFAQFMHFENGKYVGLEDGLFLSTVFK